MSQLLFLTPSSFAAVAKSTNVKINLDDLMNEGDEEVGFIRSIPPSLC